MDISAFYNVDHNARELALAPPVMKNGTLVLPMVWQGDQTAETWGLELDNTWEISDKWKVTGSYSYLNARQFGGAGAAYSSSDPQHQVKARTYYDITKNLDVSTELYWTSRIKGEDIPAHLQWDASLGWRPEKHMEVSAGVRNILSGNHPETMTFPGVSTPVVDVPRTFFVQLEFKF
jgi:iron complex outermembrane receptor protein